MNYLISIDIGGTRMRAACFPQNSYTPNRIERIFTQGDGQPPLERLLALVKSVWPQDGCVLAIGVAAAGPVDPFAGTILEAPNIPGWIDLPLRQILASQFGVTVVIGNDANLAALGEWKLGAGKGHHHLIYITVSTGIGGGVICDDRLLLGVRGLAAELGHITVLPDGPLCGCGQRGHLEAVASGPAIARWVEEEISQNVPSMLPAGQPLNAQAVADAALKGDELSVAALARAGSFLGKAIADYLHIFNPTAVILGGGVTRSGRFLLDPLHASLEEHVFSLHYLQNLIIDTAQLGDDAGLMGALSLAQSAAGETG